MDQPASRCVAAGAPVTLAGRFGAPGPAGAGEPGVVSVEVRGRDGTTRRYAAPLAGGRWSLPGVVLSTVDDEVVVTLSATDSGGQRSTGVATFHVDGAVPVVELRLDGAPLRPDPAGGPPLLSHPVHPRADVREDSPYTAPPVAHLTLDGEPLAAGAILDVEGRHHLEAVATDCAGHRGEASLDFVLDRTPPRLLSTVPAADSHLTRAPAELTGVADGPLAAARVKGMRGSVQSVREAEVAGATFRLAPALWFEGRNDLTVELEDAAGNRSEQEVVVGVRRGAGGPGKPATAPPSPTALVRFVSIPAGSFTMGCTTGDFDCAKEEKPPRRVSLTHPFEMAATETTNDQYRACVAAARCNEPARPGAYDDPGSGALPVEGLSWYDAVDFCRWIGGRLPTEAEWEYAARGGREGARYPWGNEDPVCTPGESNGAALASPGCSAGPRPVGSFAANGFGLYDIAGNAPEWVADRYDPWYYRGDPPAVDPPGPTEGGGDQRTVRDGRSGGWWFLRVSRRRGLAAGRTGPSFRCAREPRR